MISDNICKIGKTIKREKNMVKLLLVEATLAVDNMSFF